jgi:hypothetical protein
MALQGPQVRYARVEEETVQPEDTLKRALELARELEEMLEETRSVPPDSMIVEDARAHSTRMARAFAASLVDELTALVRPVRHTAS